MRHHRHRATRTTAAARAPRRGIATLVAALGLLAAAGGGIALATTARDVHAGFSDTATAVVQVSGSFDLAVSGTAPDGTSTGVQAGDPDPVVVQITGGRTLTTGTPVEWQVTVHATATAGRATLTLFDPEDEPFDLGGVRYPDLFSTLRFTVLDLTDPAVPVTLASDATADAVNAADLVLDVPEGGSRTVAVRAVVAEGTWRMYDGRTTSMGLRFAGVNA
ncbi:MAG TPA: hypothetical protein VGC67_09045 [Cellulomonas sp.]